MQPAEDIPAGELRITPRQLTAEHDHDSDPERRDQGGRRQTAPRGRERRARAGQRHGQQGQRRQQVAVEGSASGGDEPDQRRAREHSLRDRDKPAQHADRATPPEATAGAGAAEVPGGTDGRGEQSDDHDQADGDRNPAGRAGQQGLAAEEAAVDEPPEVAGGEHLACRARFRSGGEHVSDPSGGRRIAVEPDVAQVEPARGQHGEGSRPGGDGCSQQEGAGPPAAGPGRHGVIRHSVIRHGTA